METYFVYQINVNAGELMISAPPENLSFTAQGPYSIVFAVRAIFNPRLSFAACKIAPTQKV
jgi:hypothetical protein